MRKSRSSKGSGNKNADKQPLLGSSSKFDSPPNMNDLKRGFGEEEKEGNNAEDEEDHVLYKGNGDQNRFKNMNVQQEGQDLLTDKRIAAPVFHSKNTTNESKGRMKKMGMIKKDTLKIKTNPKYKCIDEVSNDGDEVQKIEDFQ